ncbi:response regulator [Paenibacillus sedimenti]|uniref:Response regulator n=1 Tax=Paenibacillus sedimenti TaxID=2770274 RepID=A0A926KU61_9BACL|nr:response regulator [Paenibacillus sedimenti]MBD0384257.1 response regulator [Paenibacillus sedimenti]
MYKALIIDDEEPARRAIRALGAWDEHRITMVDEAKDGLEGLSLLASIQPDLIFVDMRMPFLGGVEFLQQAKAVSSGKCIVVSGYDDFEFARGAITSGALDYMLKPIKKAELNQAIAKTVAQLDREQAERNTRLTGAILHNISMPLVKEKIFASIIDQNGKFHKIKELEMLIEAKPNDRFQVIVMTVLNLSSVSEKKFSGDMHACYYAITNALNELLSSAGQTFSFKNNREEQEFIIVLSPSEQADFVISQDVQQAATRLQETFGTKSMAAVGEVTERLDQLDTAYQSAKTLLMQANLLESKGLEADRAMDAANRMSILVKKDLLLHALEMGSAVYAVNIIRDFFEEIRRSGYFSIEMMLQCSTEIRIIADQLAIEGSALSSYPSHLLERFELLFDNRVMEFDDYAKGLTGFMEEWFSALLHSHKSADKLNVDQIKDYIDHHYYEDISIALFTEKHYISKEHLLRLFKQKYGSGIYEYTLNVRMDKAKELLKDPELKIQTVSEKIGYNDTNYFSKAFKKHVGVSPLEFRKQSITG